jgi:hypothetical protein
VHLVGFYHEYVSSSVTYSYVFLAENQLDAPVLIDLFILFFNSLHVSGTMCPSSGETKLY